MSDTIKFTKPTFTSHISFGDNVGSLSWEDGVLHFEGDADASAKLFIESVGLQLGWETKIESR